MDSLENYLQEVMADMNETWPQYELLRPRGQPIPFFGDIRNATVLTVGVNPSATEFDEDWGPPDEMNKMTANNLNNRLQNYFVSGQHKWFSAWEEALEPLGVSYKNDKAHLAAHIDLSPRVTVSMGDATRSGNSKLFAEMVEQDAQWFFHLLPQCQATRLMLIAGSVTNRYRMIAFVERIACRYGYKLKGSPAPRGKGFGFNRLLGPDVDLPVFFSSLSPSSRKPEQKQEFIDRVKDNQAELRRYITNPSRNANAVAPD